MGSFRLAVFCPRQLGNTINSRNIRETVRYYRNQYFTTMMNQDDCIFKPLAVLCHTEQVFFVSTVTKQDAIQYIRIIYQATTHSIYSV